MIRFAKKWEYEYYFLAKSVKLLDLQLFAFLVIGG